MVDNRSLEELQDLERQGLNIISEALQEITPAGDSILGIHSALNDSNLERKPSTLNDIRTRLIMKYFLVDVDIYNAFDSNYSARD